MPNNLVFFSSVDLDYLIIFLGYSNICVFIIL